MIERIAETSPRFKARMAGVFDLLMMVVGGLGVRSRRAFCNWRRRGNRTDNGRLFNRVKENIK